MTDSPYASPRTVGRRVLLGAVDLRGGHSAVSARTDVHDDNHGVAHARNFTKTRNVSM